MTTPIAKQATIHRLRIENYRVLRDVEFRDLTPLTVLLGPNGSGKSTMFDVFAFLHEAFTTNLRAAWDRRNRIRELRSRGENGPIVIEIAYRQAPGERLVTYRLELDEEKGSPVVVGELLRWSTSPGSGRPRDILHFQRGEGLLYDDASEVYTDEGHRGAGELLAPQIASCSGRGSAAVGRPQSASRHNPLAVLRRCSTAQGAVGSLPR